MLADVDAWVSTLLDFYGLPDDVPGLAAHRGQGSPQAQVLAVQIAIQAAIQAAIQTALAADIGPTQRFLPFLALHEFEAWLFAAPAVVSEHFGSVELAAQLSAVIPNAGGPEAINHGPHTHPKAQLRQAWPSYKETSDGPTLLAKIGIPVVRARCPHFAAWLDQLEALGRAA